MAQSGAWAGSRRARGQGLSLQLGGEEGKRSLEALMMLWKHMRPTEAGPFRRALTLESHLHLASDLANSQEP